MRSRVNDRHGTLTNEAQTLAVRVEDGLTGLQSTLNEVSEAVALLVAVDRLRLVTYTFSLPLAIVVYTPSFACHLQL